MDDVSSVYSYSSCRSFPKKKDFEQIVETWSKWLIKWIKWVFMGAGPHSWPLNTTVTTGTRTTRKMFILQVFRKIKRSEVVVSKNFYVHHYLGKWSTLTWHIFPRGWFNHLSRIDRPCKDNPKTTPFRTFIQTNPQFLVARVSRRWIRSEQSIGNGRPPASMMGRSHWGRFVAWMAMNPWHDPRAFWWVCLSSLKHQWYPVNDHINLCLHQNHTEITRILAT